MAPPYLSDDCQLVATTRRRQLRSSDNFKCTITDISSRLGDRAFAAARPPTPLEQSSYTCPSIWFVLGHLPLQSENCSSHQRLVTLAFRRCEEFFFTLLTYEQVGDRWSQNGRWTSQSTLLTVYMPSDCPDLDASQTGVGACPADVTFTIIEWRTDGVTVAAAQVSCYTNTTAPQYVHIFSNIIPCKQSCINTKRWRVFGLEMIKTRFTVPLQNISRWCLQRLRVTLLFN